MTIFLKQENNKIKNCIEQITPNKITMNLYFSIGQFSVVVNCDFGLDNGGVNGDVNGEGFEFIEFVVDVFKIFKLFKYDW